VPHDASLEASIFWHLGHMQMKSMGKQGLFLQEISGSTRGKKKKKVVTQSKTLEVED
jgi:hypothetical protein